MTWTPPKDDEDLTPAMIERYRRVEAAGRPIADRSDPESEQDEVDLLRVMKTRANPRKRAHKAYREMRDQEYVDAESKKRLEDIDVHAAPPGTARMISGETAKKWDNAHESMVASGSWRP